MLELQTGAAAGLAVLIRGLPGCETTTPSPTPTPALGSVANLELPVPGSQLERSGPRDGRPGLTDFVFGDDWADVEVTAKDRFGDEKTIRVRLSAEDPVIGRIDGDIAKACPFLRVADAAPVKVVVGDRPVVVAVAPGDGLVAYDRRVDGEALESEAADDQHRRAVGSRWRRGTRRAVDGSQDNKSLSRRDAVPPRFWLAWLDYHPERRLYRIS